ncbi:hypothetical protein NL676_008435 [Syzygium grande]|nr:hypothetical protein NL676_008435 [Syzygium grande]
MDMRKSSEAEVSGGESSAIDYEEVQVDGLEQLINFIVFDVVLLEGFVGLSSLKRLKRLTLIDCPNLTAIQGLGSVESLEELEIKGCPQIKSLDDLSDLKKLKSLSIEKCHELQAVKGLDELEALTELGFDGCRSLRFPTSVLNWKAPDECFLSIIDCPNLAESWFAEESWFDDDVSVYKQWKVREERWKKRKRSERKMRQPFSRAWALVLPKFRRNFVYRQSASTSNGKSGKKEGKKRKRSVESRDLREQQQGSKTKAEDTNQPALAPKTETEAKVAEREPKSLIKQAAQRSIGLRGRSSLVSLSIPSNQPLIPPAEETRKCSKKRRRKEGLAEDCWL